MKLNEIKENPKNPRFINPDQFKKLVDSLVSFPRMLSLRPLVVDGDGFVLGGNQRLKALKQIIIPGVELPVIWREQLPAEWLADLGQGVLPGDWVRSAASLSESEKERFIIADNVAFGEWDWEIIQREWDAASLSEWGLDLPVLEVESIPEKAEDDEYIEPVQVPERVKLGDVVHIGRHRLVCGDSLNPASYQALFSGPAAVGLVVTDPPYNVDYGDKQRRLNKTDRGRRNDSNILNDKMSSSGFQAFLDDFFPVLFEVVSPGGVVYVFHSDSEGLAFRSAFVNAGFKHSQTLVWVKSHFSIGRSDYHWRHEPILYGWKLGAPHYFVPERVHDSVFDDLESINLDAMKKPEMRRMLEELLSEKVKTTVIKHNKPLKSPEHPTMKPVPLVGELIRNSSKMGDVVLDPFLGSGSAMVAAHQLGRSCYGLELSPHYCDVIVKRWEEFTGKEAVKDAS
jgi:DNA modification methylase